MFEYFFNLETWDYHMDDKPDLLSYYGKDTRWFWKALPNYRFHVLKNLKNYTAKARLREQRRLLKTENNEIYKTAIRYSIAEKLSMYEHMKVYEREIGKILLSYLNV